jgi:hypothetical protein
MRTGFRDSSIPARPKLRRYLLIFVVIGFSLYLVLPQFNEVKRALLVARHLRPFFLGLALTTQVLSYLGSGYLVKTTVARAARAAISVLDGTGSPSGLIVSGRWAEVSLEPLERVSYDYVIVVLKSQRQGSGAGFRYS